MGLGAAPAPHAASPAAAIFSPHGLSHRPPRLRSGCAAGGEAALCACARQVGVRPAHDLPPARAAPASNSVGSAAARPPLLQRVHAGLWACQGTIVQVQVTRPPSPRARASSLTCWGQPVPTADSGRPGALEHSLPADRPLPTLTLQRSPGLWKSFLYPFIHLFTLHSKCCLGAYSGPRLLVGIRKVNENKT